MGRLSQAPSWGFALTPDTAGSARPSPGRAQTRPNSSSPSDGRPIVLRHPATSPRSSIAGAEVAPNKRVNLSRRRSGGGYSSQTARRLRAPR